MSEAPAPLCLAVVDRSVRIQCEDAEARDRLTGTYGGMLVPAPEASVDLDYRVQRRREGFSIGRGGQEIGSALSLEDALFLLDEDLVVGIQRARQDLHFVHAAALEHAGRALLLVAESGGGKSTTTWALLHHGFRYGSDELAPVEPGTGRVHDFPLALCLKSDPPASYPLPAGVIRTARARHIPVDKLPGPRARFPCPLAALFFVRYQPEAARPSLRRMAPAEAAARLFAQTLNGLAHPGEGLDTAIAIASRGPCFNLEAGELGATSRLVLSTCS